MNTARSYHFLFYFLSVCIALSAIIPGDSYASVLPGVKSDFLRNNTSVESNEVASNVLRIKNNTGKTVRFHLNYSVPAGWVILGQTDKEFEIAENDSMFVPIRIIPDKQIKGGTSYVVTVTMVSDKNVQFAAQNWYVTVPAKSNWTVRLPLKHQFFINEQDSSGFQVQIRNDGNADEELRFTLIPDRRLEILRANDAGVALLSFTIALPVGADTTIYFPIIRKPSEHINQGRDADLHTLPSNETYSIQVLAKATGSGGSWSGTTQFTKAGNHARSNEFARSSVPLTLEANVYDVLSNGTTMSLDAYGNTSFAGNRLLSYRFQTVFINNYFNEKSFLGNNHYIGYFDQHKSIELGEVNGWGRSLLTGKGIKASYNYGKNTLGAMYTRSPGFFRDFRSEGYGFYHNLALKRINLTNQYSLNSNNALRLKNEVYNTLITYKLNNHHQFTTGGGYSQDHVINNNASGYGYNLNYSGTYKKLNIALGNAYGTPAYVLARGINMYTSRLSWSMDHRNNFSLSTQNFTQHPSYFSNGVLIAGNYIRSDRYEFRWGINTISSTVAIKPSYLWDENPVLRVGTRLLGFEYNAKNIPGVRFSAMGTMGYARAVDYALSDFFVSRFNAYARWENFYLSFRYTYGPTQLAEQMRFIVDRINPQSLYMVGTYDYWIKDSKLLLSTTGNFLYETYFKKYNFRLRPEIFYYSASGLRISFYTSFFSSAQSENPLYNEQFGSRPYEKVSAAELNMGFGIRKQFGIPVPGKKFVTMHAVIFKDLNGNHKQDQNEEGVENILVNIRSVNIFNNAEDSTSMNRTSGENFITDKKGDIFYENIPAGIYHLQCTSLISNGEWFDAGDHEFKIDTKKTIYIPLTRGVRITGSVLLERDKYSAQQIEIDLSRVRITAIDSSGKTFSVLTDKNGGFMINLPAGQYVLSINESVFGDNFVFIQNKISLDLSKNFENFSITFNAIERKRKMEIKKFDNNDTEKK